MKDVKESLEYFPSSHFDPRRRVVANPYRGSRQVELYGLQVWTKDDVFLYPKVDDSLFALKSILRPRSFEVYLTFLRRVN